MAQPFATESGTPFALVLSGSTDSGCGASHGAGDDPYPAGGLYYDARPAPPGWLATDTDLVFTTFVNE